MLKQKGNLSIEQEGNCGTSKRHYVGRSYEKIQEMVGKRKWREVFSFCYGAIFDIIR